MSFKMIQRSAKSEINWGMEQVAKPFVESRKQQVGEFYHSIKHPLCHLPEGGTAPTGFVVCQDHNNYP